MIHLDSVYENIGGEEVLVNRVLDDNGNKLGQIYYKHTGNKSKPWQPQTFEMKPGVALKVDELKDVIAELEGSDQTSEPKDDMTFLCLGVIEYQRDFFKLELERIFNQKIDNITWWKPVWTEEKYVHVCMADLGIHSEIKSFVTGFRSGFQSAL